MRGDTKFRLGMALIGLVVLIVGVITGFVNKSELKKQGKPEEFATWNIALMAVGGIIFLAALFGPVVFNILTHTSI